MQKHLMATRTLCRNMLLVSVLFLAACSPKLDWREVRDADAGYTIMMPARPTIASREINLNGTQVNMHMTAAEVDGLTFAVGSAHMPDAATAQASLSAMKTALVRNIQGSIIEESTLIMPHGLGGNKGTLAVFHVHAKGAASASLNGQARILQARFFAVGNHVSQVIVMGPEEKMTRDVTNLYFSSLQLN